MYRIGIDLVEIERIKKSMKSPSFMKRVFGETEMHELLKRGLPAQSAAAAFAAKEAFAKAMGTGIKGFSLNEVELLHLETGKPFLRLSGAAAKLGGNYSFDVSVTHTSSLAQAVVIAWKND